MAERKEKMQSILTRAVGVGSVNEEQRTIDVVWATETPVRMYSWSMGPFEEVLSMKPEHIRMDRMKNGAPVLDNHDRYSGTRTVLGVVENPTISGNQGVATLRFSKRKDVEEGAWQDVKDGILKGVSAGYRVYKYEEMNPDRKQGELPKLRAIDWEPLEVSLAPVQADANSRVRSEQEQEVEVEVISTRSAEPQPEPENQTRNNTMSNEPNKPNTPEGGAPAPVDMEKVRSEATLAERKRTADIHDAVRKAKLGEDFAVELVNSGKTIEEARAAIIEKFAAEDPNAGQRNVEVGADEADKKREVMTAALVLRSAQVPSKEFKPELIAAANEYRSLTLLDLAKDSLERSGVSTKGLSKMEIAGRAISQSTSDFPVLLEGTNRRILLAAYNAAPDVWRQICAIGSVSDFREYKRLRMGTFSDLDVVGENSEFKNKSIPDAEFEKISAKTKGNLINVSRQMIVNDDLSAFTRLAAMLGRAAARSIENDVFALFGLNGGNGPTMADGNPLFHASHGNIAGTAAAPTVTSVDAARQQMAIQKDPSGNDYLDIRPSLALSPLSLGSTFRILNQSQYDPDATNKLQRPNIVAGLFNNLVDTPRLSGTAWYVLADPSTEPVFEVAFLDGNQSPYLESEMGFEVDGMTWKVRMDYGVGAIGWRGIVKNAGA